MDQTEQPKIKSTQRLMSLDAYRGLIMITLISHGFGFNALAGHPYLGFLAVQTEHVQWQGCVFWDLIQPAFMFMVGVAMPFAFGKRKSLGDSEVKIFAHVVRRAIFLCLIAIGFGSIHAGKVTIGFVNVLPQIAFGYVVAYLLVKKSYMTQGLVALSILLVYTLVWALYPGNGTAGLWANPYAKPPWGQEYANLGSNFDMWLIGRYYPGYWLALNAIPSSATIIAGAMCGRLVSSGLSYNRIMKILAVAGLAGIASGFALDFAIPIVKRVLTTSFALYSTGWSILFLLLFFWIIEVKNYRRWAFVLVVVGMNSITAYIIFQLFRGGIERALIALFTVYDLSVFEAMGASGTVLLAFLVLGVQWYVLHFFYKNKMFFKV